MCKLDEAYVWEGLSRAKKRMCEYINSKKRVGNPAALIKR